MNARRARAGRWLGAALLVCGCSGSGGTGSTVEQRAIPPAPETALGTGVFGQWITDPDGLPAYRYTLDQQADARARFPDSRGRDRRDHVHNFGNDHVQALAFNDGYVELVGADRAPTILNHFDPEHGNFAGGFGYLDDGSEVWPTVYRWRPADATTRRVFGMGYFETETAHRGVAETRRTWAPAGDDALLVSEVTLRNDGSAAVALRHYEYWDVSRYQLVPLPSMTGPLGDLGDSYREGLEASFVQQVQWDRSSELLRVSTTANGPPPVAPDEVSTLDWYPDDVFLADLSGGSADRYTEQAAFFGKGGVARPDAVAARAAGSIAGPVSGAGQPLCLVIRHDVKLAPGEARVLRFAFGYAPPGRDLTGLLRAYRSADVFERSQEARRQSIAFLTSASDPELARETEWHSFALPAATVFHGFHGTHVTTQGSAYLYLQGIDGAPRDQALFALPLTYLRPDLARENLRFMMRLTRASDGQIFYTFGGHGFASGLGIHEQPSDLDLFFLMALAEYLAATGDVGFLSEPVPFRGPGDVAPGAIGTTVLDHARAAARHLLDVVGTGSDGLIRVRDGDWSDGIVTSNVLAAGNASINWGNTLAHGESCENTGMALWVLPLAASVLEPFDADLAARLVAPVESLRTALDAQWAGSWFTRAILRDAGDRPVVLGHDDIDLEAQPWPMIAGSVSAERLAALADSIATRLEDPSPVGAPLTPAGEVWPAVSQLLTWGETRVSPERAWRSLERQSLFNRAETYPENWIGIWTGPDGLESTPPGGTWASPVTPMTDFPALNQNVHAMALLALLRVAGIEPTTDGLRIAPRIPRDSWVLDFPLVALDVNPVRIAISYRPIVDGTRVLHVEVPRESGSWPVTVDGEASDAPIDSGFAAVPISFRARHPVTVIVPRS